MTPHDTCVCSVLFVFLKWDYFTILVALSRARRSWSDGQMGAGGQKRREEAWRVFRFAWLRRSALLEFCRYALFFDLSLSNTRTPLTDRSNGEKEGSDRPLHLISI
jgi:hypothetical protein